MTTSKESAQMVFERINRRRARIGASEAGDVNEATVTPTHQQVADPGEAQPLRPVRVDEVLFDSSHRAAVTGTPAGADTSGDANGTRRQEDVFPRSATMRFVLAHPGLALGVAAPATALLLRSRESRRLLRLALQIGMRPDVHRLIGVSAAGSRLTQDGTEKKAP